MTARLVAVVLAALLFVAALLAVTAQHRARGLFVDLERAQQADGGFPAPGISGAFMEMHAMAYGSHVRIFPLWALAAAGGSGRRAPHHVALARLTPDAARPAAGASRGRSCGRPGPG